MTSDLFKKALKEMLEDGEYDICIDNAGFFEKIRLKRLKKILLKTDDIDRVPIWALLYEVKSLLLLKDILAYMIKLDVSEK